MRFWLEWDRDTINARDLAVTFTSYASYIASREWVRERSMLLPVLICIAPDIAQERRMQRVAQARLTSTPGLVVWTTTMVLLHEQGPLAPIWLQCLLQNSQVAQSGSLLRQCFFDVILGVFVNEIGAVEKRWQRNQYHHHDICHAHIRINFTSLAPLAPLYSEQINSSSDG